ncbi:hypothetical protein HK097_011654 [Rhizophlyctis rosea]|uniref:Mic1 domain-containing protein n=1 Tax=Rhizophlyctis rosea TaxID=64517 RepID=A0AAD5SE17_9FUNG|nr:hypothetical protein HK097_011654 [Rhizophlyctis rosea]
MWDLSSIQYDRIYGAILHCGKDVAKLQMYPITKSSVRLDLELELGSPGLYTVNACDDLLLVHNISEKNTAIFDILHDYTSNPLLPAQSATITRGDAYLPDWQSHLPCYVLSPQAGQLYEVCLDLEAICSDMRPVVEDLSLLNFVLRRSTPEAGVLVLQLIKEMLEKQTDMRVMRRVFKLVTAKEEVGGDGCLREKGMVRDSSFGSIASRVTGGGTWRNSSPAGSVASRSGRQSPLLQALRQESPSSLPTLHDALTQSNNANVVTQEDMYAHVLNPLASDKILPATYMITAVLEYITAAHKPTSNVTSPYLYELLASLLIQAARFVELQQHMQNGVIQDSLPLAKMLLANENKYKPFRVLGLEMLKRCAPVEEVVDALLPRGKVLEALRYTLSHNAMRNVLATSFLDAAYASGDKMLFFNTFRCLEEQGLVPSGDHGHHTGSAASGGAGRYVSVYREMWGAVVDMEGI